ncbi:MAG: hypothetical protein ACLR8P_08760 [Clostridium fessum]
MTAAEEEAADGRVLHLCGWISRLAGRRNRAVGFKNKCNTGWRWQ